MAIKIEGVPESISRAEYLNMFTSIGIDPKNTLSLRFGANNISATVFATDPATGIRVINKGNTGDPGFLKHTVIIHIKDEVTERLREETTAYTAAMTAATIIEKSL